MQIETGKSGAWRRFVRWLARGELEAAQEDRERKEKSLDVPRGLIAGQRKVIAERARELEKIEAIVDRLPATVAEAVRNAASPRLPSWVSVLHFPTSSSPLNTLPVCVDLHGPVLPWAIYRLIGMVVWASGVEGTWNFGTANGMSLLHADAPLPRDGYDIVTGLRDWPVLHAPNYVQARLHLTSMEPGVFVHFAALGYMLRDDTLFPSPEPVPANLSDALFPSVEVLGLVEAAKEHADIPEIARALEPFQPLLDVQAAMRRQEAIQARVLAEMDAADGASPTPPGPYAQPESLVRAPVGRV